jgi:putative aminopeptidase FrvX
MNRSDFITPQIQRELIDFTQGLVRIRSYSGEEEQIIRFIEQKMKSLGYDEVIIDSMGNLLGRAVLWI